MNNGKKAIAGKNKVKKNTNTAPTTGLGKKIVAGVIIALLAVMIGVVAWEGLAPKYLLSVNGEKLKEQDLMYEIYQTEGLGAQMASLYAQFGYTEDYWTMVNEDGTTTQDSLKQQTIENYLYNRILYTKAVENGYEATEDEKKEAKDAADNEIKNLTEKKAKELGLTKELIAQKELEASVVGRYKQDTIDGLNIDKDKVKAGVDYNTYRGYNVEYFYASTTKTDDKGETVAVEDKTKVYNELETVLETAKTSDDWNKIVDSKDKDAVVSYNTEVVTSDDDSFSEDVMKKIVAMQNGDVTQIIEEEDGYYVFRMVNNDDPQKYEEEVKNAISNAEEEAFNDVYKKLYEDYKIKVYDKNWSSIVFGTVTLY